MLSIHMLKICDDSLCGLLGLIFQSCFENGKFSSEWKKANAVPTYQKNDKQLVKNYRPISLVPICSKIFECLLYNKLFHFFQENNLTSLNQSGFKSGDLCTDKLLAITHEIHKSFVNGYKVRGSLSRYLIKYGTKILYIYIYIYIYIYVYIYIYIYMYIN